MRKPWILGVTVALWTGTVLAEAPESDVPVDVQDAFEALDANDDGRLRRPEFLDGARQADWFGTWDVNRDARITDDEFRPFGDAGFDEWDNDGNGYIGNSEFYGGVYDAWDVNADEHIDAYEWEDGEWEYASDAGWFDF